MIQRSEQHASDSTSISPERASEIEEVIERVTRWAADRKARTCSVCCWSLLRLQCCPGTGLEVEIKIDSSDWASVAPVDPGSQQVVSDGARILHDPEDILITLLRACRP